VFWATFVMRDHFGAAGIKLFLQLFVRGGGRLPNDILTVVARSERSNRAPIDK
jgi:hypothetical protein